ncbi:hypothetical protein Nepgr_011760 [Nepenthes gracilis]|uniref:Uncharacterized protein n=1 Tax=Nepenthes gracilis TaxID=150966 RepID=A0AAD3SFV9_NEPGR|nr:hypothetical protein Nepgr_011760 [Nepenthes gracilis]
MGNCLKTQEKAVKIIKMDGKIIEYRSPTKVHQVLSEFTGHAVSSTLPALQYLHLNTELVSDCLYYLVPLQTPATQTENKKVKFSNSQTGGRGGCTGLRIKLVISKQELKEMIENGVVSVDGMVSQLQEEDNENGLGKFHDDCQRNKGWKPVLKSIPEVN